MASLTNLPPEILHLIYAHLRELESDSIHALTCAPVCRALLPYTQAYKYRTPHFSSRARVAQFIRTIDSSDHLGEYVRDILFNLYDDPPSTTARAVTPPGDALASSARIWAKMGAVQSIRIANSHAILQGLLALPAGTRLEHLTRLRICDYFCGKLDPYDLESYRALLDAAPNLESLAIEVDDDFPLARSNIIQMSSAAPRPAHDTLATLALHGYRPSHILAIAHVANSFPQIEKLSLFELVDGAEFPPILPLLRLPALRELEIGSMKETAADRPHWHELDLSRFRELESLVLGSGDCLSSFTLILPPTARRLEFGRYTDVPLALLLRLLNPRDALFAPALQAIELDCIGARLGSSVFSARGFPKLPDGTIIYEPHRNWILPRWTENIAVDSLEELVATAKRRGVQLSGSTVMGLEVHRKWREELEGIEREEIEALRRRVGALRGLAGGGAAVRARAEADSSDSEWEEW